MKCASDVRYIESLLNVSGERSAEITPGPRLIVRDWKKTDLIIFKRLSKESFEEAEIKAGKVAGLDR